MRLLSIISLIFISQAALSQENALLWKISGNGLDEPSYLFGTIHFLCPEKMVMSDALNESFKETDQLVLELDFDDPSMMTTMQGLMTMQDGITLSSLMDEEEYQRTDDYFQKEMGISLEQVANYKPFFLYSMLYPKILGCTPASYELSLMQMAQEMNLEVVGLETIEEQMSFIDKIPLEKTADMLAEGVAEIDSSQKEFNKMVDLYLAEDLETLYEMIQKSEEDIEGFEQFMLIDRNISWIDRIGDLAKEKSSFFAVGAGHLAGDQGVIRLLQEAGYTLTPIAQ
jgi:uncharacterized protein YbaP (TraB family)